jgi:AhpD family alkylhydroperoxidase
MLRASQINGCAWCTDMHTNDAGHAGETSLRLNLVATWREATVFTDAERADLNLAEPTAACALYRPRWSSPYRHSHLAKQWP